MDEEEEQFDEEHSIGHNGPSIHFVMVVIEQRQFYHTHHQ